MAGATGDNNNIMIRQHAPKIYHQVEARNPTYNDNPPQVPWMFLNSVSGELFTCIGNTLENNLWQGTLGTSINLYCCFVSDLVSSYWHDDVNGVGSLGDNHIMGNSSADRMYVCADTTGAAIRNFNYGGTAPGSSYLKDGIIYICQTSAACTVYEYTEAGAYIGWTKRSGTTARGVFFIEDDMVIATQEDNTVRRYSGTSTSVIDTIVIAGTMNSLHGAVIDEGNLITCNSIDNTITTHDGFSNIITSEFTPSYVGGSYPDVHAIGMHKGRLISCNYDGYVSTHKRINEV